MTMKLWMYENYIWELLGEEFIEKRLSIIDPIVAVEKRMLEKIQARVNFEPLSSVILVQCSAHWTNKPTESKSPPKVIFLRSYIHIFSNAIALTLQFLHWHRNIPDKVSVHTEQWFWDNFCNRAMLHHADRSLMWRDTYWIGVCDYMYNGLLFFSAQKAIQFSVNIVKDFALLWKKKASPVDIRYRGAYIFQRPFLRGSFLEGLIFGGKFVSQNRLG